MPDEYFKLPYPAAKADMVRYGVLYHHGGIYMDLDMLVKASNCLKPLKKIMCKIAGCEGFGRNHSVGRRERACILCGSERFIQKVPRPQTKTVSSQAPTGSPKTAGQEAFASDMLAGRKGSPFFKAQSLFEKSKAPTVLLVLYDIVCIVV